LIMLSISLISFSLFYVLVFQPDIPIGLGTQDYGFAINDWCFLSRSSVNHVHIDCKGEEEFNPTIPTKYPEIVPEKVIAVADVGGFLIIEQINPESNTKTYYALAPPAKILAKWQNIEDVITEEIDIDILRDKFQSAEFIPYEKASWNQGELLIGYDLGFAPYSIFLKDRSRSIPSKVVELGWNEKWGLVKRQHLQFISDAPQAVLVSPVEGSYDYWIIDFQAEQLYGPLNKSEFDITKEKLDISDGIKMADPDQYSKK